MAPDDPAEELAEHEDKKEEEVLEREGVEQELMQADRSDLGEELEDVQEDGAEER
jgi:hypothetical protein